MPLQALIAPILGGLAIGSTAGPLLEPLTKSLGFGTNSLLPTTILTPNEIIDVYRRTGLAKTDYYELMKKHGYDAVNARAYFFAADSLPTSEQVALLRISEGLDATLGVDLSDTAKVTAWEKVIDGIEDDYTRRMNQLGFRDKVANKMWRATYPLPSFSVQLEWASKEIYEPAFRTLFTLDNGLPDELVRIMSIYGVPLQQTKNYWAAHWNTPGLGTFNGYWARFREDRNTPTYSDIDEAELAEVGVTWDEVKISIDDYKKFYSLIEYPDYFSKRGLAASYEPIPYSTLKTLYEYGVLTRIQLVGRLRDYKFSKTSAELIAQGWALGRPPTSRGPESDNILFKYEKREFTRAQATTALEALDVIPETIRILLDKVDDKKLEIYWKIAISRAKMRVKQEVLTRNGIEQIMRQTLANPDRDRLTYEAGLILSFATDYYRTTAIRYVGKAYQSSDMTDAEFRLWMTNHHIPDADQIFYIRAYQGPKSP